MSDLIIWIAMMFFTPTYHDYPMPSKSTAPITAYYDPEVLQGIKLTENLHLKLETDMVDWCSAELVWKF